MKKIILILMMVLMASCGVISKNSNDDSNDGNDNKPTGMTDGTNNKNKVYYTASDGCKAGEYSTLPTGRREVKLECHANGRLKRYIYYGHGISYGGHDPLKGYKTQEQTYDTNGIQTGYKAFDIHGEISYQSWYRSDGTARKYTSNTQNAQGETIYYYYTSAGLNAWCQPFETKCVSTDLN